MPNTILSCNVWDSEKHTAGHVSSIGKTQRRRLRFLLMPRFIFIVPPAELFYKKPNYYPSIFMRIVNTFRRHAYCYCIIIKYKGQHQ